MLTEDYIMRMINQAVAALVRILGLKKAGKYPEALQETEKALADVLGLRISLVKHLDDETLLQTLSPLDHLDTNRLVLVADIFREQGEIYAALGNQGDSQAAFTRALNFYLEVALSDEPQPEAEPGVKIETLVENLGLPNLPPDTLWALFCYEEQTGSYSRADNALRQMAAMPDLHQDILPELSTFYERLLQIPPGELEKGGLSRLQVQAKLDNLNR